MEKKLGEQLPASKPALRLVSPAPLLPHTADPVTRESHIRMIRHLNRRYGMQMLVDQATFGRGSLDLLEDDEIERLHRDLQRAYDCMCDGVTWEDAGLIEFKDVPPICPE